MSHQTHPLTVPSPVCFPACETLAVSENDQSAPALLSSLLDYIESHLPYTVYIHISGHESKCHILLIKVLILDAELISN